MPRIKDINSLIFFKPDRRHTYEHIESVFSDGSDFDLIRKNYRETLRIVISIKLGKVTAATCKNEEFNNFLQCVFFYNNGIVQENLRHEQSKVVKYNHLVANLNILHL